MLSSLSLPSQCAICGAWPASAPVCGDCVRCFAAPRLRCQRCALPLSSTGACELCEAVQGPLQRCVCAVSYGYPWDVCVASFKFHGQPGWARTLAGLMRTAPGAHELLAQADYLLPVPLSSQRLQTRGFNQSLLLARALCRQRSQSDALVRVRDTLPQHGLARSERLSNVRQSFVLRPEASALLARRRVLLIDDVMTSGATLHAAATALRRAGVGAVDALVFARTESDRDAQRESV